MRASLCAVVSILLISIDSIADELFFVKWDKGKSKQTVAALDLAARGVRWEVSPCRTPNFAAKTSVGILVGCDDSNVLLLEPQTGKEIWRRDLAIEEPDAGKRDRRPFRETQINRFQEERPDGFLVSVSDEVFVLLGKKGEYLMRCDQVLCDRAPRAPREEQAKLKKTQ